MNGFIKQSAAVLCFSAGLFALIGCTHYRNVVDPCWPERYNYEARGSVRQMHNAQADKGHILNQTVWADDFEGDKLRESGKSKLNYIAHREPAAMVMRLYLQNAPIEDPAKRESVNGLRKKAMLAYLDTQKSPNRPTHYEVEVHDYVQPRYLADWSIKSLQNIEKKIQTGQPQIFIAPAVGGGGGGGASGGR